MKTEMSDHPSSQPVVDKIPTLIIGAILVLGLLMTLAVMTPQLMESSPGLRNFLMALVEPYQELANLNNSASGELDYLAFVSGEGLDFGRLLADEPGIRFVREGSLPGTIVVALTVPVREPLGRLRAKPFVDWVMSNNRFFLCH